MKQMNMNMDKKLAGVQEASGEPANEFRAAVAALGKAIKIHEDHMSGKLPTTGAEGKKSQIQMMNLMQRAYAGLMKAKEALA